MTTPIYLLVKDDYYARSRPSAKATFVVGQVQGYTVDTCGWYVLSQQIHLNTYGNLIMNKPMLYSYHWG